MISAMADVKEWSGEERRKILDRRKKERARAKLDALNEHRKTDRRARQICFVCRLPFAGVPGQTVCADCADDGIRGGKRNRPRF